uniref:Uncharacterized protein n=1 Tax=Mycena chlorophos TaxID=658473 RepID=A0ABQ0MDB1_MYCCL|nr:predicted protein [Mycena chlorophos]
MIRSARSTDPDQDSIRFILGANQSVEIDARGARQLRLRLASMLGACGDLGTFGSWSRSGLEQAVGLCQVCDMRRGYRLLAKTRTRMLKVLSGSCELHTGLGRPADLTCPGPRLWSLGLVLRGAGCYTDRGWRAPKELLEEYPAYGRSLACGASATRMEPDLTSRRLQPRTIPYTEVQHTAEPPYTLNRTSFPSADREVTTGRYEKQQQRLIRERKFTKCR